MLDFLENQGSLEEFLKKHVKPYDPESDDYERPPFAADIKEGKNDPIYNAHSYHTKVPPRSIIPYILHYTKPGDLILDPFCGSGMTGVAAQMCANPPADILAQYPELKDRVGARACILNDLSPAACHIAYNYNTPVDVEALRQEFERIKAEVKDEFEWLYGTEHYEPAIGDYALTDAEVLARLKNPPDMQEAFPSPASLLDEEIAVSKTWTLLNRDEVEKRLGYPVSDLPRDKAWKDIDISEIPQWICIPATIQYTIWSDVYCCEGLVTIEESTGKVCTRGKNAGKPMIAKRRVQRGCGKEIVIWDAAISANGEVSTVFNCPHCLTAWKKQQIRRQRSIPIIVNLSTQGIRISKNGVEPRNIRYERRITARELIILAEIESKQLPYWAPNTEMDMQGPRYRRDALQVRNIRKVVDFWTLRNLWAYSSLWEKVKSVQDSRIHAAMMFTLTAITYYVTKKQAWGTGGGGLPGQLFVSSFPLEKNILVVWQRKISQVLEGYSAARFLSTPKALITAGSATEILMPRDTVDYIFTDPPFGSNIYYSEPNLLWEAWLGNITATKDEVVVHRKTDGGTKRLADYARLMQAAFSEMYRVLKPGRWCTVEFNNSDGAVFEAIKQAVRSAGFEIVNMLLFDKTQKTFQQVKGAGIGVVDKDVVFNLKKPDTVRTTATGEDGDLGQQVADTIRQHLQTLPDRIKAEPSKYSDDHRTTATINSMLMNTLIPRGVSVEQLNLPYIERVCSRYFRKIGQRWYLRGEAVTNGNGGSLILGEVTITDEVSAIEWLRQKIQAVPMLVGELKPLWMRATGLLPAEVSQQLDLEALLRENFWKDAESNRWREPTEAERDKMNDSQILRVLHDAERYLAGSLKRPISDEDRCEWIEIIFNACRAVEEQEGEELPALRDFDPTAGYRMISQLFHGVMRDHVPPAVFGRTEKQERVAASKLREIVTEKQEKKKTQENEDQLELEF